MVDERRTEFIGVRVTPEMKEKLEEMAKADDRSVAYIVNKILSEYFADKLKEQSVE